MTTEEKLQEAAKEIIIRNSDKINEFEDLIGEIGSGFELASLIQRMFIAGAKSEEAAAYHKDKNKWYTDEDLKEAFMEGNNNSFMPDSDWIESFNRYLQNKKK